MSTNPTDVVPAAFQVSDRLPHEPNAERAVLGALLLDPGALLQVLEKLRGEEFCLGSHRRRGPGGGPAHRYQPPA
jgi:hypothetical protein